MTLEVLMPPGMRELFDSQELTLLAEEARRLNAEYARGCGAVAGAAVESGFLIGATWLRERERAVTEMSALSAPKDKP